MKIRFAKEEDKKIVKKLWSYSFQDSQSYVEYYFMNRYEVSHNIVLEENGTIVASLLINPYTLMLDGTEKHLSYIVGVSVFPEYRGKGYSSFLMKETLSLLQKRGDEIVLLMPIDTAIYRRYGFINTFFDDSFEVKLGHFFSKGKAIQFIKADKNNSEHVTTMLSLYHQEMQMKVAYMKRTVEDFIIRISEWEVEGGDVYLMYQENCAVGYFMMNPRYDKETAMVQELLVTNQDAVLGVMNFLNHHQTQCSSVMIHAVNKRLFDLSIEYDNKIVRKSQPFMMSRVLDVRTVLKREYSRIFLALEGKNLFVEDTVLRENNGVFQFVNGTVNKVESSQWDMKMSIDALTLLYMRQIDMQTLLQSNMLEVTDEIRMLMKQCNSTIQLGESYSNDYV